MGRGAFKTNAVIILVPFFFLFKCTPFFHPRNVYYLALLFAYLCLLGSEDMECVWALDYEMKDLSGCSCLLEGLSTLLNSCSVFEEEDDSLRWHLSN